MSNKSMKMMAAVASMTLLSVLPVAAQDRGDLRARLIERVLCGALPAAGWAELRHDTGTATVLVAIAQDSGRENSVRHSAIHYLARLNDPDANDYVQRTIRGRLNPSDEGSIAALAGLSARRDSWAIELLRIALVEGDYQAQRAALYSLGQIPNPEAIEVIRATLQHHNPNLRMIAQRLMERRD